MSESLKRPISLPSHPTPVRGGQDYLRQVRTLFRIMGARHFLSPGTVCGRRSRSGFSLNGIASSQISQKCLRLVVEAGKYAVQIGIPEVARDGLAEHAPEIGG